MPPRNPLQQVEINGTSPRMSVPRLVDLHCYESMPLPQHLSPPVCVQSANEVQHGFPTLDALFALSGVAPPLRANVDTTCWCLDQCAGPVCLARFIPPARKRKAHSPEPRLYSPGDDSWVQTFTLWHPGDFDKTIVEMDSDRPLRAIFRELCADLRIDRNTVRFVWKRNRRRGGVQNVVLQDTDAPWDVGMKEATYETVECEYVS
jgi:hypothetical protein